MEPIRRARNYLPFFLGAKEEMDALMQGHLKMPCVLTPERRHKLLAHLPQGYKPGDSLSRQIENGTIVHWDELLSCAVSTYPLEFSSGVFQPLDPRYQELGDTALILLNPLLFRERILQLFHQKQPYLYDLLVCDPSYVSELPEDNFLSWEVSSSREWMREILLLARKRMDVSLQEDQPLSGLDLTLPPLGSIALEVPVLSLIQGNFPPTLSAPELQAHMNALEHRMKRICGYQKEFLADIAPIEPAEFWISQLQTIFPPEDWVPYAFSDRLRPDGRTMARLKFVYRTDSHTEVSFGCNFVRFHFSDEALNPLIAQTLTWLDKQFGQRYCGMRSRIEADLGVRNARYRKLSSIRESFQMDSRDCNDPHLQDSRIAITQKISSDSMMLSNIWGVPATKLSWHYSAETTLPSTERLKLYTSNDMLLYFQDTDRYLHSLIRQYLDAPDPFQYFQVQRSQLYE